MLDVVATEGSAQPVELIGKREIVEKISVNGAPPQERSLLTFSPTELLDLTHKEPHDLQFIYRLSAETSAKEPDFEARNREAARGIAAVEAADAVREVLHGQDDARVTDMFQVMFLAAQDSGERYSKLFNEDGTPKTDKAAQYGDAHSYAGDRARQFLPLLVNAARIRDASGTEMDQERVDQIAQSISFTDSLAITAAQMGITLPEGLTNAQAAAMLEKIVGPDDVFRTNGTLKSLTDQLAVSPNSPITLLEMPEDERAVKDLALRLAHTTWAETQVAARVPWEVATKGGSDRLQRANFNPSGVYQTEMYKDFLSQRTQPTPEYPEGKPVYTPAEALMKVAYEVHKDAAQYEASQYLPTKMNYRVKPGQISLESAAEGEKKIEQPQ